MWKLTFVIWTALVFSSHAALTLVTRETFQGVGVLNSANPGNLGAVTGNSSFYKRAVGPRLTSDTSASNLGWSADLHLGAASTATGRHDLPVTGATQATGFFSCWYYIDSFISNGTKGNLTSTYSNNTNPMLAVGFDPETGTFFYIRNGIWSEIDTHISVPIRQWFELRQQWVTNGNEILNLSADYRLAGSAAWIPLYTAPAIFSAGATIDVVRSGNLNMSGSGSGFRGRYGLPSLYTMDNWQDRYVLPPDVLDPVQSAVTWHVNPASGNDANDGLTPTTAWATVGKINLESQHCGFFPHSNYLTGDSVQIDTSTANLVLGPQSLNIRTPGLNVMQLGNGEIQAWTTIPPAHWSGPIAGTSNVYQATLTETNLSCVLWEDDKWLNHPTGNSLSSVQAALNNTSGSFWTDGTTMYLHPFGDSDPRTDSKTYTRSYSRGTFGDAAIQVVAADFHLQGLRVRKTCLAEKNTNDSIAAYCLQTNADAGGESLIENCHGAYGSKHVFGFTDNSLNKHYTVRDCSAEQGSPYYSQTPWVDYSSAVGSGANVTSYVNCTTLKSAGLIGSTEGASGGQAWLTHNSGSTNFQFERVEFLDCHFADASLDTYGAARQVYWKGGEFGGGIMRSPDVLIEQAVIVTSAASALVPTSDTPNGFVSVRNSLILVGQINAGFESRLQGSVSIEGCTIDLRSTVSNGYGLALYKRAGSFRFSWKNNLLLFSSDKLFSILRDGSISDQITFSHNAYNTTSGVIAASYNNGTGISDYGFPDWQMAGQEAGSITASSFNLGIDYMPQPGSPLLNSGQTRLPGTDLGGQFHEVRNDIGAWEALTPIETWRQQHFGSLENLGVGADTAIATGDGISNLLKYATGLPPFITGVLPIAISNEPGEIVMQIQKNPLASDVSFQVETSNNLILGNWTTGATVVKSDTSTLLWVSKSFGAGETASFLRLRVTRN